MIRSVSVPILMLLSLGLFASEYNFVVVRTVMATIIVPDDVSTIQEAINNANVGDTIYVRNGTYYEDLVISKPLSIVGENESVTIVDGGGFEVFYLPFASDILIKGFTIRNGYHGIYAYNSENITIQDTIIMDNHMGVQLHRTPHCTLNRNHMMSNTYNFVMDGWVVEDFVHEIDTSNFVDGRPMCYVKDQDDVEVPLDVGYVAVVNSTNVTVRDLILEKNGQGVFLVYTRNSVVQNVTVSQNLWSGISIWNSSNNLIVDNNVTLCRHGISLWGPSAFNNTIRCNQIVSNTNGIALNSGTPNNTMYHNALISNTNQVLFVNMGLEARNTWDNGCEGNYWSNYNGSDLDGDGIGDDYLPWESVDYYPLMSPYIKGDVNHDSVVDILDAIILANAFGATSESPGWNLHCDLYEDGRIDILDAILLAAHFGEEWT